MPTASFEVDDQAFLAAVPDAIEALKALGEVFIVETGDKVVQIAEQLAPVRTGALRADIKATPFVRTATGGYVEVSAGTREAFYQEFGTSKMRAHPFMRPALAEAAGGSSGGALAVRLATSSQSRAAVTRAAKRQKVRRAYVKREITSVERRILARAISRTNRRPRRSGYRVSHYRRRA